MTVSTSIDSLSPESPMLKQVLRAEESPWVKYNNIAGVIEEGFLLRRIAPDTGDGVVPFQSAHLDDAESEIVVEADHVNLHQHPLTILEVRRILLAHSDQMYAEAATQPTAIPAGYHGDVSRPASQAAPSLPPADPRLRPLSPSHETEPAAR